MNLEPFGWAIGISDLLNWRECPARMKEGMRRHLGDEPPEATNWTNQYGSAIHECVHLVDKHAMSHERAIERVMQEWAAKYLTPEDVAMLREDLAVWETRRPIGVTLVASEQDMRVPLFVHDGQQIFFRFKLDTLYRSTASPGLFLHRDLKSSKWPKSPQEVHSDLQMWSYNWGIHERWPECEQLVQTYDQLRAGEIQTTKNDEQRATMKQWLIDVAKALIADDTMAPKLNDWCRYCPLVVTCPEPRRAMRMTRAKLAALAPMTREGRKVKVAFAVEADELDQVISEELPGIIAMRKHAEHVEKALKEIIQDMPSEERERLKWRLQEKKARRIGPDGLRELHALMGDAFYSLATLSITKLEELVGKPKKGEPVPAELALAREWTVEEISGTSVVRDD